MPGGDGRGPAGPGGGRRSGGMGRGRGGGRGMGSGRGMGRGAGVGRGTGAGRGQTGAFGAGGGVVRRGDEKVVAVGSCVCPACGTTVPHRWGVPCNQEVCPNCGAAMTRKD